MKIIVAFLLVATSSFASAVLPFPTDDEVNYQACIEELAAADTDADGVLKIDEYEEFVQAYKERILCGVVLEGANDEFTSQHQEAFRSLACMCRCRQGHSCCEGDKAQVETAGADNPNRTCRQHYYLTTVCQVTDGSIVEPRCSEVADIALQEQAKTSSSLESENEEGGKVKSCFLIVLVVGGGVLALALAVFAFARLTKHRRPQKTESQQQPRDHQDEKEEQDENTTVANEEDDATVGA